MYHYTLSQTTSAAYQRWKKCGVLTADMAQLMTCVETALAEGQYYTADVLKVVVPHFNFTEEEQARGTKDVEGGVVGMEIYYARHRVEAYALAEEERQARSRLGLTVGMPLATFTSYKGKRVGRCIVDTVEPHIMLSFTRGNRRYRITTTARQIEQALKRA